MAVEVKGKGNNNGERKNERQNERKKIVIARWKADRGKERKKPISRRMQERKKEENYVNKKEKINKE